MKFSTSCLYISPRHTTWPAGRPPGRSSGPELWWFPARLSAPSQHTAPPPCPPRPGSRAPHAPLGPLPQDRHGHGQDRVGVRRETGEGDGHVVAEWSEGGPVTCWSVGVFEPRFSLRHLRLDQSQRYSHGLHILRGRDSWVSHKGP